VSGESPELMAARKFAAQAASILGRTPSFQQLAPATRTAIVRDLETIRQALDPAIAGQRIPERDPYALALETPNDLTRRRNQARQRGQIGDGGGSADVPAGPENKATPGPRVAATETLASRAGALSDEIDFPAFVAGLVHGTFDAIVDATIRQMEAFADLVSSVAKGVDAFTRDNVTANQARDWLVQQYPRDLVLETPVDPRTGPPQLRPRTPDHEVEDQPAAEWLTDFGLAGEPLTDDLIEEQLIPAARRRVGESRLQMLATMVLLGMNRIIVKDGSISARVRFRAAAKDKAQVNYATSQDPGDPNWGTRGNALYENHSTMISTVGVNVQSETDLKVELFGEVKINFVSETLPLDRFVDQARMALLQSNARWTSPRPEGSNGRNDQPGGPATPLTSTATEPPSGAAGPSTPMPSSDGGGR